MKKILTWGAVGLLSTAMLDPLYYSMLEEPIPWLRDLFLAAGGMVCFYLLVKFRREL